MDKQDIEKPGSAIVRGDRAEKAGSDEAKLMIMLGRKKKSYIYVWMNIERYGKIQLKTSIHIGRPRQLFCVVLQKGPCRRTANHRIWDGPCQKCKTRPPDCTGKRRLKGHHIARCGGVVNPQLDPRKAVKDWYSRIAGIASNCLILQ